MEPLRVEVDAVPAQLTPKTLATLTIRGMVTNLGTRPVDIQSYSSDLLVDGAPSMAWSMAIGNGPRDQKEEALPPGDLVVFQRVMGGALFDQLAGFIAHRDSRQTRPRYLSTLAQRAASAATRAVIALFGSLKGSSTVKWLAPGTAS